jgi:hypothetical protein
MGFWKRHFSSKHLDSGDFTEGQRVNIRIVAVADSDEEDTDGEKKMKITFKAGADFEKQLAANSPNKKAKTTWVCSKTIGYCLAEMFGDDDAAWVGKVITVYAAKIRDGEAVRVYGSPQIDHEHSVKVRDFGGKKTWVLKPTAKPKQQSTPQTDGGEVVPAPGDAP